MRNSLRPFLFCVSIVADRLRRFDLAPKKIIKLVVGQFQLAFSLAPWLQPGGSDVPRNWKPFRTVSRHLSDDWSPGQATVLMRAKLIQTTSVTIKFSCVDDSQVFSPITSTPPPDTPAPQIQKSSYSLCSDKDCQLIHCECPPHQHSDFARGDPQPP